MRGRGGCTELILVLVVYYFITSDALKSDIKIHLNKVKPKFECKKRDNCGCLVWGTRGDPPN